MPATETVKPPDTASWRPLRLETLMRVRWVAIGGQTVGVLFVAFALGFPLPLIECLGIIVVSALLNLAMVLRYGNSYRPSVRFATIQLAFDCLQLGALLALTGGLHNPFSILLLAPVSVSATILPQRATVLLAVLVMAISSFLWVFHLPLPWDPDSAIIFDNIYVFGLWVSLLSGVLFIAIYTNRVAYEARQLSDALAATELALSRHEQLRALDGLAAAAAHELGTPLSTIALAAREMRSEVSEGPLAEDIDLIIGQAQRCRAILGKLRNLGVDVGDPFAAVPLSALIAEVAKPHENRGKAIIIGKTEPNSRDPVFRRNVGLLYGLGNLLENAVGYARTAVTVEIGDDEIEADGVTVTITDDGPGYPPELLDHLGEPYLTTRSFQPEPADAAPGGLGLGIFIAKTLLERTGARIRFSNAEPDGHARVTISWPRAVLQEEAVTPNF